MIAEKASIVGFSSQLSRSERHAHNGWTASPSDWELMAGQMWWGDLGTPQGCPRCLRSERCSGNSRAKILRRQYTLYRDYPPLVRTIRYCGLGG